MNLAVVQRILGLLLMLFSVTMLGMVSVAPGVIIVRPLPLIVPPVQFI